MKKLLIMLCIVLGCSFAYSEDGAQLSLSVLPSSDTSELGLAEPLQYALGQVLQSTGTLKVQLSGYSMQGFTPQEVEKGFETTQTDLMSFTYMEKQRVSVFLFAKDHPREFIVASRMLDGAPGGQLTSEFIETRFREAVNDVLASYNSGSFQALPGATTTQTVALDEGEQHQRAEEARTLFRELTSLEKKSWFFAANIGMARYSQPTTDELIGSVPKSTVNLGTYAGLILNDRFDAELGADAFSYLFLHSDIRYHIPALEKYIHLSLTAGAGRIMAAISQSKLPTSDVSLVGTTVFGPGIGFDIPLLGATLRGEAKFYLGSTSVVMGSYGVILPL